MSNWVGTWTADSESGHGFLYDLRIHAWTAFAFLCRRLLMATFE
jgi:hypothetical protein